MNHAPRCECIPFSKNDGNHTMANAFDPYREALVMEQVTIWGPLSDPFDVREQEAEFREHEHATWMSHCPRLSDQ